MNKKYRLIKKCNICGQKNRKIILSIKQQNVVICDECQLIYLDKQRIDIDSLYNKDYYSSNENNSVANYCNYENQEKVIKNKFKFAYSYIHENTSVNKKILEIGAGYGFFLKFLSKKLKLYAIEISKAAAWKILENNSGAKVYNADFNRLKLEESFDFIVSFDVIEHQTNLKKYLIKVHSLLDKEGAFMFTTPDYGTFLNKMFGSHAPAIQPLYHNYYFDHEWIKKNLPKFGFKIIYLKTTHFEPMNIGTILLYLTFAFPIFKKINLLKIAKLIKIENLIIPFFRFGGIECIAIKS